MVYSIKPVYSKKRCSTCKKLKYLTQYTTDRYRKDGFHNQCKSCKATWRKSKAEYFKEYGRKWRIEHPKYWVNWDSRNSDKTKEYDLKQKLLYRPRLSKRWNEGFIIGYLTGISTK